MFWKQTKTQIYIGSGIFLFIVFFIFIVSLLLSIGELKERRDRREKEFATIVSTGKKLLDVRRRLSYIEASSIDRDEKEILLTAISTLASNAGVKKHIKTIDFSEQELFPPYYGNIIDIKLEGVSFERLKAFLSALGEYRDTLHPKRIVITTRFDNPGLFDSSLTFLVLERKG